MRALLFLVAVAFASSGCEVANCNEDAVSTHGVCFPEDPALAQFMPTCGNNICEKRGRMKEDATSCPADCDGGFGLRAGLLHELTINVYNDHVANRTWPGGQADAQGACPDGGSATARGPVGSVGDENMFSLDLVMTGCTIDLGSYVGKITADGGPFRAAAQFNTSTDFSSMHLSGSATLAGSDGDAPYSAILCDFDYNVVRTGTTGATTGTLCGKQIRRVQLDM